MERVTEIPMINMADNETGCCPRFHPESWDDRIMNLDDYTFIKVHTKSLFHMPLNMGGVFTKAMEDIKTAGAETKDTYLILSRDLTAFKAEHYFLVNGNVPEHENVQLKGDYFVKVYEGPYKEMPNWMNDFHRIKKFNGFSDEEVYAFYTTCPKCAKHYGKNYVVLFSKI